ncbi:DDB1- and CUL4-associated factor 10 homolog [Drosophila miranda]|uniref:DDB1- and CUL4-associated factor 10 homolog n=1 Tax=Drosophila miranda TaxID=7229 RepID=UPI00143F989C|nr:DDB1- and CUL4-associated factor 10 homolog [Drosophila miranda]
MEQYLSRRERGIQSWGDENFIMRRIYTSINMFSSYYANQYSGEPVRDGGAIFNLEFNADGNVMVAATERKSVLVFDANTQKEIFKVPDAHTDSVNCIKFVDARIFATGSDDLTVAMWDLRNMREKLRVLHGHSNWVKNIEYSPKDKLLVSSSFDGSILTWNTASHTEQGLISERVFHVSGLLRCRISPMGDKLVLCTSGGYIMVIHRLDLTTLYDDLSGFRPDVYRLMQVVDQYIPVAAKFDHLFSRRQQRNRVELVTDFTERNDANMILALQIHPNSRCMLTRVSYDENREWTCIHDINEDVANMKRRHPSSTSGRAASASGSGQDGSSTPPTRRISNYNRINGRGGTAAYAQHLHEQPESFPRDIWTAEITVQQRAISPTAYDSVDAISSEVLPLRQAIPASQRHRLARRPFVDPEPKSRKLMYYTAEANVMPTYIKEPGFSADGRIICSPYGNGVRLLGYSADCCDYPIYTTFEEGKKSPRQMVELAHLKEHQDAVLCAKFSPREPLLVTGCAKGDVTWYRPNL